MAENFKTRELPPLDSQKGNKLQSGDQRVWNKMFDLAESGLADPTRYAQIQSCLDLTEFTDFIILHLYAGMADWDHANNWFAARPRSDAGKYRFYIWDAERTLEDPAAFTIDFDDKQSPPRLFHCLCENSNYRAFFAQRATLLLDQSGPLGLAANRLRYQALVDTLRDAIPLEAARWGAYRRDIHPWRSGPFNACTAETCWLPAVNQILNGFFPTRGPIIQKQFSVRGLWTNDDNLRFRQEKVD